MAKVPNDYDLDFLKTCTKEELSPIVGAILSTDKKGNIDKSGRITSELDTKDVFKKYYPDHTKYVDEIIEEIQGYGANSIATMVRGCGVSYHEILCDVCEKLKVNFNKLSKAEVIEEQLLAKVLTDMWEKMTEEERKQLLEDVGDGNLKIGGAGASIILTVLRAGGFTTFKLMLIIVNTIAKIIMGKGFTFLGNMILVKTLSLLMGPIGWILTGVWTMFDIAAPAYRVTVPAVIYIAALRGMKRNEASIPKEFNENK